MRGERIADALIAAINRTRAVSEAFIAIQNLATQKMTKEEQKKQWRLQKRQAYRKGKL